MALHQDNTPREEVEAQSASSEEARSLGHRVIHAAKWAFAVRALDQGFRLARIVVLARLLSPESFGIFGVAVLALSIVNSNLRSGFQTALIQRRGDIRDSLDTAWVVQVVRGLVVAAILYASAGWLTTVLGEPKAVWILRAISLSVFVNGLHNPAMVFFSRNLEFRKRFTYRVVGSGIDLAVSVSMAVILRSPWALVGGVLARAIVGLPVSYWLYPHAPRWRFDRARARELFSFGRWIAASNVMAFFLVHVDDLLVSRLLGPVSLAYYQLAYRVSNTMATEISHVVNSVMMPALSRVQDEEHRFRSMFLQSFGVTAAVALPLAGLIVVVSRDLTLCVFGEKWLPSVASMQVLAIWGATRALVANVSPAFAALGHPRYISVFQGVTLALMLATIYPLIQRFGVVGAAWSVSAATFAIQWVRYFALARLLHTGLWVVLENVVLPLAVTGIACGLAFGIGLLPAVQEMSIVLRLLVQGLTMACLYIGGMLILERLFGYRALSSIRTLGLAILRRRR